MKLITGNPNRVQEFRGLFYEGREILATKGVIIDAEDGLLGWNCIMENGETEFIPKKFFEEELDEKIAVGVE